MNLFEIILIAIALSMDAVAVSISNGMVYPRTSKVKLLIMVALFAIFQALMPLIGFYIGAFIPPAFSTYANLLVALIFIVLGVNMIKESMTSNEDDKVNEVSSALTYKILCFQAIATSIDALAVGLSFSLMQVAILPTVTLIGCITFICCGLAVLVGKQSAKLFEEKSGFVGGAILILLAIQALL